MGREILEIEGYCEGETCNRNGCKGIIEEYEKDGCCSCHSNPPCGYCTEPNAFCYTCGWDAKEEQSEYDKKQSEIFEKQREQQKEYYENQRKEQQEADDLFVKMWRGSIPAEKLIIRTKSHTHFTMIKYGVFPEGSQTEESLLKEIRGTFGGRFTIFNNYRFEYIAYTD